MTADEMARARVEAAGKLRRIASQLEAEAKRTGDGKTTLRALRHKLAAESLEHYTITHIPRLVRHA